MSEPVRTPAELFDLTGRVALVTGASSGLGRRIALVLAAAGATVAVTARRTDRLVELESEIPNVRGFPCDLTRANGREALVTEIESQLGPIDILVNNAGAVNATSIENESLEDFANMIELNLTAAWHLMKLVGVSMVERQQGSIVNIASILGVVGATPAKDSGYSAAKGGLVNLTREMGLQWARKGVRVNAICPGWFQTEMIEDLTSTENGSSFITTNTPMMRVGNVNEIDGAILLLASDAGSFMTGSIVMVDGGWTAR
jgi:NAD(P)-dependent dehydrogenase (short-subunit alcohol dehydrogenase family)